MPDPWRKKRSPGRPSQPLSRRALLDAARAVFAEHGYAGASLELVARRAGIRKPSLFHHVASKEALYLEVLVDALGDLGQLLAEATVGDGTFTQRLDNLGVAVTRYFGERPELARLLLREVIDRGPFLQSRGTIVVETLKATAAFLATGMRDGDIPPQDPAQLAISVVALHITYFAAAGTTSEVIGAEVFSEDALARRYEVAREQVRRLCGAPVDDLRTAPRPPQA